MPNAVENPIRLTSIFETWCITHCFKTYEEMEEWLKKEKLELKAAYKVGKYLCCIAGQEGVEVEKVL